MDRPRAKPLIGITTGTHPKWKEGEDYYESYALPLRRAGADCIPLHDESYSQIAKCDGVLLSGGWDVHPDHYVTLQDEGRLSAEEVIRKYHLECEPQRDEYELPIAKQALDTDLPILAICRGIQLLNIVLGGKLVPDIEKCVPGALQHRASENGTSARHEVQLEAGSILLDVYNRTNLIVNSRHHQGLLPEMIPSGFKAAALAPDGIVEAMEFQDNSRFIVGVQWHPERQQDSYIHDLSGRLFEAFVEACRQRMRRNK